MEAEASILALAALAQSTRLEAFRLLVRHEPEGLPAGDISNHLAIPANTLSSHLAVLSRAGLIQSERRSRSIIYRADLDRFRDLVLFLPDELLVERDDAALETHMARQVVDADAYRARLLGIAQFPEEETTDILHLRSGTVIASRRRGGSTVIGWRSAGLKFDGAMWAITSIALLSCLTSRLLSER